MLEKGLKGHLFICCRKRENKQCCQEKASEELVQRLKKWSKELKIDNSIKISSSSCLGDCEKGIAACLYPQNQWFSHISLDDEKELQDILFQLSQS